MRDFKIRTILTKATEGNIYCIADDHLRCINTKPTLLLDLHVAFPEICEHMQIDEPTGKRVLHSLACGKYKLLDKTGHHRTINCKTDLFESNAIFYSKLKRFKVQMSMLDGDFKRKVNVEIQQQRGFGIDAT